MPNPDVNFLIEYNAEKFDAFVRYAIELSAEGRRGRDGGSIVLSHAFDNKRIQETYKHRFSDTRIKEDINCLFWKESFRVSSFIKQNKVNLDVIFSKNEQMRFLMPIRNPVDCALSNMNTGHAQALTQGSETCSYFEVLNAVLKQIKWFIGLQKKYPDRFFCFFENEFDRGTVCRIAHFLGIEAEPTWIDDVISNYDIKHSYEYTQSMKDGYAKLVSRHFESHSGIRKHLESFFD